MVDVYPRVAEGEPIFEFLRSWLDVSGGLDDSCLDLPDEPKVQAGGGLRWVAGGLDGAVGYHAGSGASDEQADLVAGLFADAAASGTRERLARLYESVAQDRAREYVDPMIGRLIALEPDWARVRKLGRWLATTAPDRGAVKVGLAVLGVAGVGDGREVVRTLGAHEEFTLYAAVAIRNGVPEGEQDRELWAMAQHVYGWGRVQCVERLKTTTDPEIRAWILRAGFRNSVMDEYLAYIAATTGDLLGALRSPNVDRELLTAAGRIITALVYGGPAEDLDDYEQGADAVSAFMSHMATRADTLDDFLAVSAVKAFLTQAGDWEHRAERGWTQPHRQRILEQCGEVLDRAVWDDRISADLRASDVATFWRAHQAARIRGIDTFDLHLHRLTDDPLDVGSWSAAWNQADDPRAWKLADLARRALPLDEIASGAADVFGFATQFRAHGALDLSLQALRDFPGIGGDLIAAGLQSPVTRNRNMALNALTKWPPQSWPPAAHALLTHISATDPNETTRGLGRQLLNQAST